MDSPASLPSISRSFLATCFGAAMVDLDEKEITNSALCEGAELVSEANSLWTSADSAVG
jgi:hypothetical protein